MDFAIISLATAMTIKTATTLGVSESRRRRRRLHLRADDSVSFAFDEPEHSPRVFGPAPQVSSVIHPLVAQLIKNWPVRSD